MTIATKLQLTLNTKQEIKQALINKGAQPGDVFSEYPAVIENLKTGADVPVGTIARNKLIVDAEGWIPANGSAISIEAYPDLYSIYGDEFSDGSEPEGYFRVPYHLPIEMGNVVVSPMIRVAK